MLDVAEELRSRSHEIRLLLGRRPSAAALSTVGVISGITGYQMTSSRQEEMRAQRLSAQGILLGLIGGLVVPARRARSDAEEVFGVGNAVGVGPHATASTSDSARPAGVGGARRERSDEEIVDEDRHGEDIAAVDP
jgi:hypothetical protein